MCSIGISVTLTSEVAKYLNELPEPASQGAVDSSQVPSSEVNPLSYLCSHVLFTHRSLVYFYRRVILRIWVCVVLAENQFVVLVARCKARRRSFSWKRVLTRYLPLSRVDNSITLDQKIFSADGGSVLVCVLFTWFAAGGDERLHL